MEDTIAAVARFIEKLHSRITSPPEKELVAACLLRLAKARKETRTVIGSHAQAMPLFIPILRSGTSEAKVNVAATLSALCKDDGLQVKVLLGGCIPPLLSLLKSKSIEARKAAAEAIYEVSSGRSLMIKSVSRFAQKVWHRPYGNSLIQRTSRTKWFKGLLLGHWEIFAGTRIMIREQRLRLEEWISPWVFSLLTMLLPSPMQLLYWPF